MYSAVHKDWATPKISENQAAFPLVKIQSNYAYHLQKKGFILVSRARKICVTAMQMSIQSNEAVRRDKATVSFQLSLAVNLFLVISYDLHKHEHKIKLRKQ